MIPAVVPFFPIVEDIEKAIGLKFEEWKHQCHAVSKEIVQSGIVEGRVARGWCKGVGGQHSWVCLGDDCYDKETMILDATLWSFDETIDGLWIGTLKDERHKPHGAGNIWGIGRPDYPVKGKEIELSKEGKKHLTREGAMFLDAVGQLDRIGWGQLASGPMEGWPARQIIEAMLDTEQLAALVPIDIAGMVTDRNPSGLYKRVMKS